MGNATETQQRWVVDGDGRHDGDSTVMDGNGRRDRDVKAMDGLTTMDSNSTVMDGVAEGQRTARRDINGWRGGSLTVMDGAAAPRRR